MLLSWVMVGGVVNSGVSGLPTSCVRKTRPAHQEVLEWRTQSLL